MYIGFIAAVVLVYLKEADAGQMCAACIAVTDHKDCTYITECANNEKCYMHSYQTEFTETNETEKLFDFGCTSGQGCPTSLDYIIGKRDGHHIKCEACCNDTRLCNLQLTCDNLPNPVNTLPRDCSDLFIPTPVTGIHTIYPFGVPHRPVPVYCQFDSNNRVWTC